MISVNLWRNKGYQPRNSSGALFREVFSPKELIDLLYSMHEQGHCISELTIKEKCYFDNGELMESFESHPFVYFNPNNEKHIEAM